MGGDGKAGRKGRREMIEQIMRIEQGRRGKAREIQRESEGRQRADSVMRIRERYKGNYLGLMKSDRAGKREWREEERKDGGGGSLARKEIKKKSRMRYWEERRTCIEINRRLGCGMLK